MSRLSDRVLALGLKERDFPSLLLWSIVALTTAALLWAALARLEVVIAGTGRVIPASQLQILSNLEGGTLSRIVVKPGQKVTAGQLLMQLDPVLRASDAAVGQASVDALSVRATRLAAEARGQRPSFDMPGVDPAAVATEQALARSDSAALGTERSMAMARQEQASRAAAEADATLRQKQEALRLAQREEAVMRPLVEQGAEPGLTLDRVTSQRVQAESGVRAADENLRRARAAVAEARRGDIVLVAGKGHEQYQEISGVRRRYSDAAVVRAVLAGRAQ